MMSGMQLETCRAFIKLWSNKFYYKVVSCWLFLLVLLKTEVIRDMTHFRGLRISQPLE
jgi:hypothetical protein